MDHAALETPPRRARRKSAAAANSLFKDLASNPRTKSSPLKSETKAKVKKGSARKDVAEKVRKKLASSREAPDGKQPAKKKDVTRKPTPEAEPPQTRASRAHTQKQLSLSKTSKPRLKLSSADAGAASRTDASQASSAAVVVAMETEPGMQDSENSSGDSFAQLVTAFKDFTASTPNTERIADHHDHGVFGVTVSSLPQHVVDDLRGLGEPVWSGVLTAAREAGVNVASSGEGYVLTGTWTGLLTVAEHIECVLQQNPATSLLAGAGNSISGHTAGSDSATSGATTECSSQPPEAVATDQTSLQLPQSNMSNVLCSVCLQIFGELKDLQQHECRPMSEEADVVACKPDPDPVAQGNSGVAQGNSGNPTQDEDSAGVNAPQDDDLGESPRLAPDSDSEEVAQPKKGGSKKKVTSLLCTFCPFKATNKITLRRHTVRTHGKKQFTCDFCKNAYSYQFDLTNHLKKHQVSSYETTEAIILEVSADADGDQASASVPAEVRGQRKAVARDKKTVGSGLICNLCDFTGCSKASLNKHRMREHKPKRFACKVCKKEFCLFSDLSRHCKQIHQLVVKKPVEEEVPPLSELQTFTKAEVAAMKPEDRPKSYLNIFRCDKCAYVGTEAGLKAHLRRYHVTLSYLCDYCPHSCSQADDLTTHMQRKHLDKDGNLRQDTVTLEGEDQDARLRIHKEFEDMREKCGGGLKVFLQGLKSRAEARHICHVCGYKSDKASLLRIHMMRHHSQKKRFRCHLCFKEFFYPYELKQHDEKSHRDKDGNVVWPPQKVEIDPAEREHVCEICNARFTKKLYLRIHSQSHVEKATHLCELCGFSAKRERQLKHHLLRNHREKEHVCTLCGKKYAMALELKTHMEVAHLGTRQCKCSVCGKVFQHQRYLKTHMKLHDAKMPFKCETCGKDFRELRNLVDHSETHKPSSEREPRVWCSVCHKGFLSRGYLNEHMNIHSGARPFSCKLCGESFKLKSNLAKHVKYHSGERPHKCPVAHCGKAFKERAKLQYHMVIHTHKSKHMCDACGKAYTQLCTLKRHVCKAKAPEMQPPQEAYEALVVDPPVNLITEGEDLIKEEEGDPVEDSNIVEQVVYIQEEDTEADAVYMCSVCSLVFNNWEEVEAHVKGHGDVEIMGENVQEEMGSAVLFVEETDEVNCAVATVL